MAALNAHLMFFYSKGATKYMDSQYTRDQILHCHAPYALDMSLPFTSLIYLFMSQTMSDILF